MITVGDHAAESERTTEVFTRMRDVATGQSLTDHRRTRLFVAEPHQPKSLDLEVSSTQLAQGLDVAGRPMPESEVLPHHDQRRTKGQQHLLDELLRGVLCESGGEVDHLDPVGPRLPEQRDALVQAGQQHRAHLGPQHADRVRPERDHDQRKVRTTGVRLGQHLDVPGVHAIEVADDHHRFAHGGPP